LAPLSQIGGDTLSTSAAVAPFEQGGVRGFLHRPATDTEHGLVLTHGAGGNCRMPMLIAAAEAFSAAGITVLRCDLPFRQRRSTGPPSPSGAAADRAGLRDAVAEMRRIVPGKVFLGGQSYGGRQATMLAAEEPEVAQALLLFSYPLHPPGQPARLRTEHFPRLRVPALFVQGTKDPFGTVDELGAAIQLIPAPTLFIPVDGAGHDLRRGRFDLAAVATAFLALAAG
jgi:predicted alpha/beta-hydrolase family hydrolase